MHCVIYSPLTECAIDGLIIFTIDQRVPVLGGRGSPLLLELLPLPPQQCGLLLGGVVEGGASLQ